MIPVYQQHIVRSHIGRERANAKPIQSTSLPPPSRPWPGGRVPTLSTCFPPPSAPWEQRAGPGGEKADCYTVDPLSTASGPSADLLHQFSHLQQKEGIWNPHDLKWLTSWQGTLRNWHSCIWNELCHSNGYHSLCTKLCSEVLIKKHMCVNVVF